MVKSAIDAAVFFLILPYFIKPQLLYLLAALSLFSCKKENRGDCFKSNGDEITEARITASFKNISLNSKIDLTIYKGSEFKVELSAGKHITKNILTKVEHDTLKIENINTCNFVRGYKKGIKLSITLPHLNYLVNTSVGTVRFADDFAQDSLDVKVESSGDMYVCGNYKYINVVSSGNGDVYIKGKSDKLWAYMYGTNYLHAEDLIVANEIYVESVSFGDCFLNAKQAQRFEYKIHKSGNIYYSGNPIFINNLSEDKSRIAISKN
jgi:hypothetical protein